jgi:hypothetical protein
VNSSARVPVSFEQERKAPMSWLAASQIVSLLALALLGRAGLGMPVRQRVSAMARPSSWRSSPVA